MASTKDETLQVQESNVYQQWMNLQESELSELLRALKLNLEGKITDSELTQLTEKSIKNFEDYIESRIRLARQDPSPFFAPPWCTTLENSALWLGGCRPSSYIRLIYSLTGLEIETRLAELLNNGSHDLGGPLSMQLGEVDKIRMKVIREEERLSRKLACLHEHMSDQPLAEVVNKLDEGCESNCDVDSVLDENEEAMAELLGKADRMRLETFKELIGIMTPLQAVQFIAASKKLRLCTREWGKKRDKDHGRFNM